MGRPPFTRPTERPVDSAAQKGNLEEFSQFDQTVVTNTVFETITTATVGTDINSAPIFLESVSIAYFGGIASDANIQWRLEIDDENDSQDWLKYGGSGSAADGAMDLPGIKAEEDFDIGIQIRNQTGTDQQVSTAFNFRTE